ncbi:hypothetical protein [Nitrosophilus alvini]|uniref:hypothetical protein n=1 Tax=Nitrosophilus alvini TaxID=2714855 RepID=UPI00190D887C|nr:hypothetical protein [Nitrosophilus alvini]
MKLNRIFMLLIFAVSIFAGEADVKNVNVEKISKNTYNFHVTVKHSDEGQKHYADRWEILDENGEVLAIRILHHPHIDEQPFTRSMYDVELPKDVKEVKIRAHDLIHGYGGEEKSIKLP